MHEINQIITYFTHIKGEYYITVLRYLLGATGIAVIVQGLKRKYGLDKIEVKLLGFIRLDGPKIIVAITGVMAALASASAYLLSHASGSPLPVMASEWAKLLGVATIVHRFAVGPTSSKIESTLTSLVKDANAYRDEQAASPVAPVTDNQFTV